MNIRPILIILLFLIFVVISGCLSQDNGKIESLEKDVQDLKNQIKNMEKQQTEPLPTSPDIASDNITNENKEINKTDEIVETNVTDEFIKTNYTPEKDKINDTLIIQQLLYVSSEMKTPSYWSERRYELTNFKVKIINQQYTPVSIKSQVISDNQILEEESFTLLKAASSYEFYNEKKYFMNNTDVILRLYVQSYKPIDYKFKIVSNFN